MQRISPDSTLFDRNHPTMEAAHVAADFQAERTGARHSVWPVPRSTWYRVQREPEVGDDISYQIGADSFYVGKVTRVTKTRLVVGEETYYRQGDGKWRGKRGIGLVAIGKIEWRDPQF